MKSISPRLKKKSDLIAELAEKKNISIKLSSLYVNTITGEITNALLRNKRIELRGFGVFSVKNLKGYTGKNPKNQTQIIVPAKKKPWFKSYFYYSK